MDTDFWNCTSEGTSLAAPYVSGVAAMMKAIVPEMLNGGIKDILQDTANPSADPRVVHGYINALDALREAVLRGAPFAFHGGPVLPPSDEFEPNDFAHRGILSPGGRYCLNLGRDDDEDGFYFFLGDYRNMELTVEPMFDLGLVTAKLGSREFPVVGELTPGSYQIEVSGEFGMPNLYCLTITDNGPATIAPDRFEPNNNLPGRVSLNYPNSEIDGTYEVTNLNFHIEGDRDCFGLTLPDLPFGMLDSLSISAEPSSRGREELFVISVFGDAGTEIDTAYNTISIERIRREVPSGEIQFCIEDNMWRRNYYDLVLDYHQYYMGVNPPSPARYEYRVPAWIETMDGMYFYAFPVRAVGEEPFDRPYPCDPEVVKALADGTLHNIPEEMLILLWEKKEGMKMEFTFVSEKANDLNIRFRGQGGKVIAEARVTNVEKNGPFLNITKKIEATGLSPGVYAFELKGQKRLSYRASLPQ
jgi:hypothetical protein